MGTIKRTFANSLTGTGKLSATNLDSNIPAANIADASVTNVTTLPESLGQAIKSVAGSPPSQAVGDIWYNTITGTLKNYVTVAAAWASGGNLPAAKNGMGGFGTQTSAITAGGTSFTATSQSYDGASWTATPSLSTGRTGLRGFGISTAGAVAGGETATIIGNTEEYDGSTWTAGGTMNTARYIYGTAGTLAQGIAFGGLIPAGAQTATELYDGTSWTTSPGSLPSGRYALGGSGTQTAALAFGGGDPGYTNTSTVSDWDGTSWASNPHSMNTARRDFGFAGSSQDGAIIMGGQTTTAVGTTESYDGSAWTTSPSLATARAASTGAGTESSALTAGGSSPTLRNQTEEWTAGAPASPTGAAASTLTTS